MPFYEQYEKKTNVKLEFIHPPAAQEKESFNLMIASQDFPDIVEYGWQGYPGGTQKAIEDKVIVKLNDVVDKYAPELKKFTSENPDIAKQYKTDIGALYVFPALSIEHNDYNAGFILRKDWLDELNLAVPETVDEGLMY